MITKELLSPNMQAAKDMAIFYHGYNWLLAKPLEILAYAKTLDLDMEIINTLNITQLLSDTHNQLADPDQVWAVGAIFVGSRVYSGLVRRSGTRLIGKHYGIDTERASFLSLMPYGEWAATLVQVAASVRRRLPI